VQAYFTEMSGLHKHEIQELMGALKGQVRKASDDELEASALSFPLSSSSFEEEAD
jgi:hypothetical protein